MDTLGVTIEKFQGRKNEMQEKVKQIKEKEQDELKKQHRAFNNHVEDAIESAINTRAGEIEKWTETEVDPKIEELKSFKAAQADFLDLPIVKFANQAPQRNEEIKVRGAQQVAEFVPHEDKEYAKGEYVFENFKERQEDMKDCEEIYYSKPIMVEGVCYRLKLYPNGEKIGKDTHIAAYINRIKSSALNLDTSDKVSRVITMLHPSERSNDYVHENTSDWVG